MATGRACSTSSDPARRPSSGSGGRPGAVAYVSRNGQLYRTDGTRAGTARAAGLVGRQRVRRRRRPHRVLGLLARGWFLRRLHGRAGRDLGGDPGPLDRRVARDRQPPVLRQPGRDARLDARRKRQDPARRRAARDLSQQLRRVLDRGVRRRRVLGGLGRDGLEGAALSLRRDDRTARSAAGASGTPSA